MKSVHKALHLRHHKHTGKLLAHKHTSYHVLFLLMLVPIFAMAFSNYMVATADEYVVTAVVPAEIPTGRPVIESPSDGSVIKSDTVEVRGACPVANPSVLIAIREGSTFLGSGPCDQNGEFSVIITTRQGTHTITATVVTITGQDGSTSVPVTYTRPFVVPPTTSPQPSASPSVSPSPGGQRPDAIDSIGSQGSSPLLLISLKDVYVVLDSKGKGTLRPTFSGGTMPYRVKIEWGDGKISTSTVINSDEQAYEHVYDPSQTTVIKITVIDENGNAMMLQTVAVSYALKNKTYLDSNLTSIPPAVGFIEKHALQIYILTLSSLVFLWYIEHGRHFIRRAAPVHYKKRHR